MATATTDNTTRTYEQVREHALAPYRVLLMLDRMHWRMPAATSLRSTAAAEYEGLLRIWTMKHWRSSFSIKTGTV